MRYLISLFAVCFGLTAQITFGPSGSGSGGGTTYNFDPTQFGIGAVTNITLTNGVIITNLSLKGTALFNGSSSGIVTVQPAAAAGTWTMTLPVNDGDASQLLTTDGSGVTSWTTPSASVAFNGITAATANSSINNGAYTNEWKWSLTGATQTGLQISENTASTGGSGAQELVNIETLSGSTANPLRVAAGGVEVFRVSSDGRIIAANGTASNPAYSFASITTAGMRYDSGASRVFLQYDSNNYVGVGPLDVDFAIGGAIALNVDSVAGVTIYEVDGSPSVFNSGATGNNGVTFQHRVAAKTSATVTLSSTVGSGTTGPGTIYNNNGTSAMVRFDLPTANQTGTWFTFYVDDADGIEIQAAGSATIQFGTSVTAGGGDITSTTIGSCITLLNVATDKWVAKSIVGTWAD